MPWNDEANGIPPVSYLLNILYLGLLVIAFPRLLFQSARKGKYREGFAAKFLGRVPRRDSSRPCVWLHAVSVGEMNLLPPLVAALAQCRPDWECVISTTTMTGMALARKKFPGHLVFYCPLDFSWAVRTAMRRIRPDLLVLAETELWPNLIRSAKRSGAKVAIINARLSDHSFRGYRRVRPLVAWLLRQVDLIAVQDETYAERFRQVGAGTETVVVTGSMKYDGAQTDRRNPATERLRRLAGFAAEDVVFLAGSTQEPEEAAALAAFQALKDAWPGLRLVLVPRHPDRFECVARLLDRTGLAWQRRTALPAEQKSDDIEPERLRYDSPGHRPGNAEGERPFALKGHNDLADIPPLQGSQDVDGSDTQGVALGFRIPALQAGPKSRILLVDTIGELGAWWGTAQVAFVGGSLGRRGGQNMIEPAGYGAAVSFGPNTRNFRDIVATMLAHQAAVVVRDPKELTEFVRRCLAEPDYAAALGTRARALVLSQLGATERTVGRLLPLIEAKVRAMRAKQVAA